jgi:hypothetical protein
MEALFARARELMTGDATVAEGLFIVMVKEDPSSAAEAVYIMQTPPRRAPREYRVVHVRTTERLPSEDGGVHAVVTEKAIDPGAAEVLERSWGTMARAARWPDREGSIARMKFGGTVYTFDYSGDNVHGQGEAVSPEPGSCSDSLVGLGELLARFADEPSEGRRDTIREELLRKSQALAERLDQSNGSTDQSSR